MVAVAFLCIDQTEIVFSVKPKTTVMVLGVTLDAGLSFDVYLPLVFSALCLFRFWLVC